MEIKKLLAHLIKTYYTYIGCTQCVRAYPTNVLEMILWDGCKVN